MPPASPPCNIHLRKCTKITQRNAYKKDLSPAGFLIAILFSPPILLESGNIFVYAKLISSFFSVLHVP